VKAERGVEVYLYSFFNLGARWGGCQRHCLLLYPEEWLGTLCIGGWVGPKPSLDGYGKSRPPPGLYLRTVQLVACRCNDWPFPVHLVPPRHMREQSTFNVVYSTKNSKLMEEMEFVFGMCTFHTALLVKQFLARNYEFQRSFIFSTRFISTKFSCSWNQNSSYRRWNLNYVKDVESNMARRRKGVTKNWRFVGMWGILPYSKEFSNIGAHI
jgi:hypothetical protein